MRLTIGTTQGAAMGDVKLIEVASDAPMETVAELIAVELQIPTARQRLLLNGVQVPVSGTAGGRGLSDGDFVIVENTTPVAPAGSPGRAASMLQAVQGNPQLLAQLRARNPALADATVNGDEAALAGYLAQLERVMGTVGAQGSGRAAPPDDPMSADVQRAIEQRIREENVMENMAMGIEHNPKSFGSVVMLFVDCEVNGTPGVKAFVGSGAQATIISKDCAEKCNILRLMDTRFHGVARGVGTAKIYGRIHLTLLTLGTEVFEVSFTVMDAVGGGYDMLLGLDMLRKHQASIDLGANCLRIGNAVVPFLPEKDIPRRMREHPEEEAARAASAGSGAGRRLGGGSTRVNETAVAKLVELGFSRDEAAQALQACDGDADQAASMLTQTKYGFCAKEVLKTSGSAYFQILI